jgi:hypothetical protein
VGRKYRRSKSRVMIVPNQSNLKVHFAGAEQTDFSYCLSKGANVKYFLFTVFGFIANSLGIKHGGYWKGTPIFKEFSNFNTRHSIMDSGLFTLMFGAHAGKRTEKEIEVWYNALIKFVLDNDVRSSCVEVDCQKILGTSKAWELRERMRNDLPNNRIINVFHKEDGQNGLERMIEFSDYIAISVPELRSLKQKKYTYQIAHFIKNKKPNIDIHLLGCTEKQMLKDLNFCSTSDSTSWLQINRYGNIGGKKEKNIIRSKMVEFDKVVLDMGERYGKEITPNRLRYYSNYILSAKYNKQIYNTYAGNQD